VPHSDRCGVLLFFEFLQSVAIQGDVAGQFLTMFIAGDVLSVDHIFQLWIAIVEILNRYNVLLFLTKSDLMIQL